MPTDEGPPWPDTICGKWALGDTKMVCGRGRPCPDHEPAAQLEEIDRSSGRTLGSVSEPSSLDLGQVVVDALRRLEKEIRLTADRIVMAMHVGLLSESPEFRAQFAAAEEALAAGFPDARPGDEVLGELRARFGLA
jgi:hypothetical protein